MSDGEKLRVIFIVSAIVVALLLYRFVGSLAVLAR
jgi:hypothetical protein